MMCIMWVGAWSHLALGGRRAPASFPQKTVRNRPRGRGWNWCRRGVEVGCGSAILGGCFFDSTTAIDEADSEESGKATAYRTRTGKSAVSSSAVRNSEPEQGISACHQQQKAEVPRDCSSNSVHCLRSWDWRGRGNGSWFGCWHPGHCSWVKPAKPWWSCWRCRCWWPWDCCWTECLGERVAGGLEEMLDAKRSQPLVWHLSDLQVPHQGGQEDKEVWWTGHRKMAPCLVLICPVTVTVSFVEF